MKKQAAYLYAAYNDQDDLINKSVYSVVIKVTGKQAANKQKHCIFISIQASYIQPVLRTLNWHFKHNKP